MVAHTKTKLFLRLSLLFLILSVGTLIALAILSLLSSLWIIMPIVLFVITIFTGINAIYSYSREENKSKNELPVPDQGQEKAALKQAEEAKLKLQKILEENNVNLEKAEAGIRINARTSPFYLTYECIGELFEDFESTPEQKAEFQKGQKIIKALLGDHALDDGINMLGAITILGVIALHPPYVVSLEALNALSTQKIINTLRIETEPTKPNLPQNWKSRLFSYHIDSVPPLNEEIVFSKSNKEKAEWVYKHCRALLNRHEFIFDDQNFLSQFTSEVRSAVGDNQTNKDYEIGIKYFPHSNDVINQNNANAVTKAVRTMNEEYGQNTVEAISIVNETVASQSSYTFRDHEELTISQAGIDCILAQEWKKEQFRQGICKIFDSISLSVTEQDFIRQIFFSLSRWHDPRNKYYHFYFVSVSNTEKNKKAFEDWLDWVAEKIHATLPNDFKPILSRDDSIGGNEFRIGLTIKDEDIDRCLAEFQKKSAEKPESTLSIPVFHNEKEKSLPGNARNLTNKNDSSVEVTKGGIPKTENPTESKNQ